eukprot:PhF_6_TR7816/c0_g1_i1/m.11241
MHKFTNLFVTVQRHESAEFDSSCFRMTLQTREEAGGNCNFKILPRFKIRSEGEPVIPGDKVVLQIEHSDLHVHTSSHNEYGSGSVNRIWSTGGEQSAEINASENTTTFCIFRYDIGCEPVFLHNDTSRNNNLASDRPLYLKDQLGLGRTTILLHKESEAVVTCHTNFANHVVESSSGKLAATRRVSLNHSNTMSSTRSLHRTKHHREQKENPKGPFLQPAEKSSTSLSFDVSLCSCNSLWLIEHSNPTIGGLITIGVPYRLRHVASGRYLGLGTDHEIVMVDLKREVSMMEKTLFKFHPVLDLDIDNVTSNQTFLYIQHHSTGLWIGTQRDDYEDQTTNHFDNVIPQLCVLEKSQIDNAIALFSASPTAQQDLNTLVGNIEYLTSYTNHFRLLQHGLCEDNVESDVTARHVRRANDALTDLIRFCTKNDGIVDPLKCEGLPILGHQQMLFDLQVHRLAFEVLVAPFVKESEANRLRLPLVGGVIELNDITSPKNKNVHLVCRLCYRLLKQMAKGNGYFASLLEEYIPFMMAQEGYKLHVADTLLAVFSDNAELSPSITHEACRHFIALLKTHGQSAGYIRFLSKLCAVREAGVRRNQEMIVQFLLHENPDLLIPMRTEEGRVLVSYGKDWKTLHDFFRSAVKSVDTETVGRNDKESKEAKAVKFYESMIELFSKLCIGGNAECLLAVESFISREHALIVIASDFSDVCTMEDGNRDKELANRIENIKATYLNIILHLYLKRDLDKSHEHLQHNDVRASTFTAIVKQSVEKNFSEVEDSSFLANLKLSLLEVLEHHTGLVYDEPSRNLKLSRVLSLWHLFIQYKQYSCKEIERLINVLTKVIDSSGDKPSEDKLKDEEGFSLFNSSEDSVHVFNIKRSVCEIFLTIIDHNVDDICNELKYKLLEDEEFLCDSEEGVAAQVDAIVDLCNERATDFYRHFLKPHVLVHMMVLLVEYESTELTVSAMKVAVSLCSLTAMVTTRLEDVHVITSDDGHALQQNIQSLSKLLKNNIAAGGGVMKEEAVIEALVSLLHLYGVEDLPCSEEEESEGSDEEVTMTMKAFPSNVPNLSPRHHSMIRPGSTDGVESHTAHKRKSSNRLKDREAEMDMEAILSGSMAAHYHRANLVKVGSLIQATAKLAGPVMKKRNLRAKLSEQIISECNDLLHFYDVTKMLLDAAGTVPVKTRIFRLLMNVFRCYSMSSKHVPDLATAMDVFNKGLDDPESEPCAMFVMLQIFAHTQEYTVNLDRSLVKKFVERIAVKPDALVIGVLSRIVVGQCPIPHNQRMVLSLLKEYDLLKDIAQPLTTWPAHKLEVNYAIVDLMVYCCLGNNGTRSTAQQLLPIEKIFAILLAPRSSELPRVHQVVYLRFFGSIYLSHDETQTKLETQRWKKTMTTSEEWWMLCEHFLKDLREFQMSAGDAVAVEYIGGGVLPCLTMYFENNFCPSFITRSEAHSLIPKTIVKLMEVCEAYKEDLHKVSSQYRHLVQLLHNLCCHDLAQDLHFTRANNLREILNYLHDHPHEQNQPKRQNILVATREKLKELFSSLTVEEVSPLVEAFKMAHLQKSKQQTLAQKLVNHLRKQDFDKTTMIGILASLKYSLSSTPDEERYKAQQDYELIGLMSVVTTLLESNHDRVIETALELGIAMLDGGNLAVQTSLLNYFATNDEKFFISVRKFIHEAVVELKHFNSTKQQWISSRSNGKSGGDAPRLKFIAPIFRLLQLMCEGHNLDMQNYIRNQQDNLHSVNVLKDIMSFVSEIVKGEVVDSMLPVLNQTFEVLTELCQGPCEGNQGVLAHMKICACIDLVLNSPQFGIQDYESAVTQDADDSREAGMLDLKASAVSTLLSLLEGCNKVHVPLIMLRQLQVKKLDVILKEFQTLVEKGVVAMETKGEEEEDALELVFNIMILQYSLLGFRTEIDNETISHLDATVKTFKGFSSCLGRIEILRGDTLEVVYFRIPAICFTLTEQSKQNLLWSVNRSTQSTKLADFFDLSDALISEIETAHKFRKGVGRLGRREITIITNITMWDDVSLTIALITNFLFTASTSDPDAFLDSDMNWFGFEGVVVVLTCIQVLVTFFVLFIDSALSYPLVRYNWETKLKRQLKNDDMDEKLIKETILNRWSKRVLAKLLLARFQTIYRFAMFGGAVVALRTPYFLSVHLVGLIYKSEILTNVVTAVTQNGRPLFFTMGLGCIMAYFFSIIGFVYFKDEFNDHEAVCTTLRSCFVHVLFTGVRMGGGIADVMQPAHNRGFRILYDFMFFYFVILIFLNIVFGIILDKFAELRTQRRTKEEDMVRNCFICGIDAHSFDRYADGFANHYRKEHNMWNYLYFMHHLKRKSKDDYTGQESYVHHMIQQSKLNFFPVGRCVSLERRKLQQDDDEIKQSDIRAIDDVVDSLESKVEEMKTLIKVMLDKFGNKNLRAITRERGDAQDTTPPLTPQQSVTFDASPRSLSPSHGYARYAQEHLQLREDELQSLTETHGTLESEVTILESNNKSLELEVDACIKELRQKDMEINRLHGAINQTKKGNNRVERYLESLKAQVEQQRAEHERIQKELDSYQWLLTEDDRRKKAMNELSDILKDCSETAANLSVAIQRKSLS